MHLRGYGLWAAGSVGAGNHLNELSSDEKSCAWGTLTEFGTLLKYWHNPEEWLISWEVFQLNTQKAAPKSGEQGFLVFALSVVELKHC